MKKKVNTDWIYGLKFIASFVVILHHFALYFYPAFISNNFIDLRTSNHVEMKFALSPFNIFSWGGNVCVCIFFIISGFLISYKYYFNKDRKNSVHNYINRYLKLTLPILFSSLFYFIIIHLIKFINGDVLCINVLGKQGSYCNFDINIFRLIYESFFGFFVKGNVLINPVLWTMYGEMLGSFVIMVLLPIIGNDKKRKYIYVFLIILLADSIVFPFLLGMILCDFYKNNVFDNIFNKWYVKIILLLLSIYFCGFTYQAYSTKLYNFLNLGFHDSLLFYHTIGSILLIIVVIYSDFLKKLLSLQIFSKFKNISFGVYLFHWLVLNTYSIILQNILMKYIDYKYAFIIVFFSSIIIIYVLSHFIFSYILKLVSKYTKKISLLYSGKNTK